MKQLKNMHIKYISNLAKREALSIKVKKQKCLPSIYVSFLEISFLIFATIIDDH